MTEPPFAGRRPAPCVAVTQLTSMGRGRRLAWLLGLVLAGLGNPAAAQDQDEDYHVYTDPPRLLLNKQRLRLLQREKERESARWQQFDGLISSGAPMAEPGFATALYYRVSGNAAAGRKAVEWALDDKTAAQANLRQLAVVFDWCGPVMTAAQGDRLAAKIEGAIGAPAQDIPRQSARALAAIAIADHLQDHGESILRAILQDWWRGQVVKQIDVPREQTYPLMEMFHAVRDNLAIDLRDSASAFFQQLPLDLLTGHYPAPFPGPDNDVFVPVYVRDGQPDLTEASMSRAAGLALVAFDTNGAESQYLQGWLLQDRFTMRDPLGSAYEFLWANPYQPGLSYSLLPLVYHNARTGHVFARTSWDEDATWIGYFEGHLQLFADGRLQTLQPGKPMRVGDAVLMKAPEPSPDGTLRLRAETEATFVLGLAPSASYDMEVDDEELSEGQTDVGGTLVLALPEGVQAGVRIRKR